MQRLCYALTSTCTRHLPNRSPFKQRLQVRAASVPGIKGLRFEVSLLFRVQGSWVELKRCRTTDGACHRVLPAA